ncbi:MAG: HK97 gp10 family phage protein [Vallitalea sp.]|jgi:HK97 gp10 family phage protein|nr:HK97 gp10 family phage protein [Vallitalea sp.]
MDNGFELNGMEDILSKLEQMGKNVDNIKEKALKKAGEVFAEEIRNNVPVDTGNLKDNIGVGELEEGSVKVGATKDAFYLKFLELGTKNITPNPVMTRAYETKKNEAKKVIEQELKRELGL